MRRSAGQLTLSAAYTYSHSIDDSSDRGDGSLVNAYNFAANRASSNFDQRQIFNFSYIWDLPFFRGAGLRHALLGGWQYSGIHGHFDGDPFQRDESHGQCRCGCWRWLRVTGGPCWRSEHGLLSGFVCRYWAPLVQPCCFRSSHRLNFRRLRQECVAQSTSHQFRYGAVQTLRDQGEHGLRISR